MRLLFLKTVFLPPCMMDVNEIGWLDGFGSSQEYRCYALRCSADIIYCVRMLEKLLHWDCVFVNELNVAPEMSELVGKVFLSEIDKSKNAFIYLLPNRYSFAQDGGVEADIFSISDYYLFSKKGKAMFKSKSVGFEYLLLMSADKGFDLKPVENALMAEHRLPTEDLSGFILQRKTSKGNDVTSFLQRLFVALELECRKFYAECAGDFLGNVQQLSARNYLYVPYFQMDLEVDDWCLLREDV